MLYHECSYAHPQICVGCTSDKSKHGQVVPMFVDRCGNNYSKSQVVRQLTQTAGASETVVDHIKVGQIYRNGGLWWQRIE